MASISAKRLAKELREIHAEGCPVGIELLKADDFATWWFSIEVMGESLYKDEKYTLQFRFDSQYPISSPAVQFVVGEGREAPIHPHVYSNGHICASILGNEWSPVLSVIAVPTDNDRYVRTAPDNPKKTRFHYDVTIGSASQMTSKLNFVLL
ncbi:hypothetical protein NMY22_g3952 [Coprinellus aureogranulatus]|nr:hypothetical protein NMY22_g3952 [Coprinellus aureogranulatus]